MQQIMHEYFLRCIEADKPLLENLAVKLGIRQLTKAEDGSDLYTDVNCAWHEVGYVNAPTGEFTEVTNEETGEVTQEPVMKPKADADGNLYWHCNLRTYQSLGDIAEQLYAKTKDRSLGAAMQNMNKFFVTGEDGRPVRPKQPHVVFL
jgi:hypothetical protein